MKHKIASIALVTLLLLTACTDPAGQAGNKVDHSTSAITSRTDVTTSKLPSVTTTAPVTTEAAPSTTAPITDDDQPVTTEPLITDAPATEEPATEVPATTVPPTTDGEPETLPPAPPEPAVIPDELLSIATRYPLQTGLGGDFAGMTIAQLMENGTAAFEAATRRHVQASGHVALDKGIVTMLLNASRYDLALSYLSGANATELYSKVTTDKGKSSETTQVYMGGWLYNTNVITENGKQTESDDYKVKMTPDQFSDFALSGADKAMNDLSKLVQLISTASSRVAGMDGQGNCVILAKGMDRDLMKSILDSEGAIGSAVSPESFDEMEVAVVIGADRAVRELYFSLPMRITVTQSGITFSVKGRTELTLTIDLPASVTVTAPKGSDQYREITLNEAYAKSSFLFNW